LYTASTEAAHRAARPTGAAGVPGRPPSRVPPVWPCCRLMRRLDRRARSSRGPSSRPGRDGRGETPREFGVAHDCARPRLPPGATRTGRVETRPIHWDGRARKTAARERECLWSNTLRNLGAGSGDRRDGIVQEEDPRGSRGQALASFTAPGRQYPLPPFALHARAKAVRLLTASVVWLVGAFHRLLELTSPRSSKRRIVGPSCGQVKAALEDLIRWRCDKVRIFQRRGVS
jgi:hypothetical protein